MLTCKEVVRILGSNQRLTIMRKLELTVHLGICKYCSAYKRQLKIIKDKYSELFKKKTEISEDLLRELEQNVIRELKK